MRLLLPLQRLLLWVWMALLLLVVLVLIVWSSIRWCSTVL
jgi:hypothetical protein